MKGRPASTVIGGKGPNQVSGDTVRSGVAAEVAAAATGPGSDVAAVTAGGDDGGSGVGSVAGAEHAQIAKAQAAASSAILPRLVLDIRRL